MSEAPTHGSSPGDGQRQHDAAEDGSGSFSNAPRSAVSPRAKARYLDRESLRLVVDGAPDAIFVQVDKRFAYLNPAAVRLFGARDASQLLGQPVIERFEPAHHDRIREGICLLNEERQVVPPLDQVYIRLDGQRIDVETSGAPVTFEGREGAIVFVRDIGFRLKAAEALRSSEERFRAVFERTNVAMAITDCEGRVLGCNLAFEQLLGYSLDELRHTQIPCLAAPEDAEALHALYKEVWMQWRHSGRLEARYFHKDGRTVWSEVSLSSICEACGQVSGVIVVLVDLSHRKAAEQARRRSDERLRRAMESIPDVVVVYDRDLRIQYINAATRKITGRPASDLLGKRDEELWPEAVFGTYLPVLREALATRQTRFIETEITIQPGNPRSLQITCVPVLDERGEVLEVLGITHDFTENKLAAQASRASEAKYRRLYETTMDGFASVDMDGHFLEFNETYATMLGYQPEELRALTFLDVTPRKWHAIETEIIQKQVIGRGYSDIYEKEYRRKDGEIIAVELRTVLLRNPDGTPAGMWGLARQITDRKRMEQALLASEQRYRSFVEASAQVVWRTHPDGRVDWELPSWQAFSGQTPEQARGLAG